MLASAEHSSSRSDVRLQRFVYRAQNLRLYPLILVVLCVLMPLFSVLDYYLVGSRAPAALRDLYITTDRALAVFYISLYALYFVRRRFVNRHVLVFFLAICYAITLVQIYLLSQFETGAWPYILMMLLFTQVSFIHMRRGAGFLNLGVLGLIIGLPLLAGWPVRLPEHFIGPWVGTTVLCVGIVAVRHTFYTQLLTIHRRNRSLNTGLREVRRLKRRQDGDYFLTSLLVKPLSGNHVRSSRIAVDIATQQKNAFRFRRWDVEIGGDLSTAYRIQLQNRSYIAFLNGDAMGKSIQGASGALVLGTVFKSIVSRFEHGPATYRPDLSNRSGHSPESWLADCYEQLQDVFSTFDGSMMATVVCGLLEEQQGVLYYVNAEHPSPVLLRGGEARFLMEGQSEFLMPRLGMLSAGAAGRLQINVTTLQPQDVLVLGSDGRQDISLHSRAEDDPEINEDAAIFLKFVEAAGGDPGKIVKVIGDTGKFTDDISVLALRFSAPEVELAQLQPPPGYLHLKNKAKQLLRAGDRVAALDAFEKALAFKDDDPEIYPVMAELYIHARRYKDASRTYETLAWLRPANRESLFLASYGVRASAIVDPPAPFERGIRLGERYRLRHRESLPNLLNLAELYRMSGNPDQARLLLFEARELAPENARARRLLANLNYRGSIRY